MQRVPPELTDHARRLRRDATQSERLLWRALSRHRPRFTRQLVVGHFIIDIACRSVKLGVELDGGHHAERVEADTARIAYLAAHGWRVLRFWNNEVIDNLDGIVAVILADVARGVVDGGNAARGATHPRPLPSREGS